MVKLHYQRELARRDHLALPRSLCTRELGWRSPPALTGSFGILMHVLG